MKKIMIVFIACLTIFVATKPTSAQTFKDVKPSASYYNAVEMLVELGAISSKTDTFNPNGTVTRGQAAKILAVTLNLNTESVQDPGFKDVPVTNGFYPYVAALQNKGIINGKTTTHFGVNDPLTRGQMAKILVKGFDLPEFELEGIFENEPAVALGKETRKYVSPLYLYGITTGQGEGKFGASNPLKRNQLALFVERTYNMYDEIQHDRYMTLVGNEYDYPESTEYAVADVIAVGYDGGFILRPYMEGQTAIYYGDKAYLMTVHDDLSFTLEHDVAIPDELKGVVEEYRYYDYPIVSAASYSLDGELLEDFTPAEEMSSLSFLSRDTDNFTRLEIILENGDLYEYYAKADVDETKRYYITKLYERTSNISFYYFYNYDGEPVVQVPADSGLLYTLDDEYVTFKATKPGKFEVSFGQDVRNIEVIEIADELAIREFEVE